MPGIWKDLAILWGLNIAISQVPDALKDVFPFSKTHKATREQAITPDSLFIDAQPEWDNRASGRYSNELFANRSHTLKRLQHNANRPSFPNGPTAETKLLVEAQARQTPASNPCTR